MARDLTLVLDLSAGGFVAVFDGDKVLAKRWKPPEARHDGVGDWAEECLREAGAAFADLQELCVGVGPGSFTGLRIAMAFAQGLALPRKVPTHGFSSFAPLHLSGHAGENRLAIIPAQPGKYYASRDPNDPGQLLGWEALKALGASGATLAAHAPTPALDPLRSCFARVFILEADWDVAALAHHARASGLGADKPRYLALSAAEAKAGLPDER